jgi:hypothetical protein
MIASQSRRYLLLCWVIAVLFLSIMVVQAPAYPQVGRVIAIAHKDYDPFSNSESPSLSTLGRVYLDQRGIAREKTYVPGG